MGTLELDATRFRQLVADLSIGKRLPDAVYLHIDALPDGPPELQTAVQQALTSLGLAGPWNVVKLAHLDARISFQWYPRFFDDGFPALASSTAVDLESGRVTVREYEADNAPILHRKETLLPPGHLAVPTAAALTEAAEAVGLFEKPTEIGRRQAWEDRLARLRLRVDGHRLVGVDGENATETVHRHRTALTRYGLSTPMQALWRHGFLDGDRSVFDYGCGRGDDLRALVGRGLNAAGWDPHFAPDQQRHGADVVNLGFVLNVIEDPNERRDALLGAWALTRRVLSIGVLIGGRSAYERFRLFRDGVLTARGTFQKYFTTGELRDYVEGCLQREPIALAPGIVFVFRDDADEQAFLARRSSSRVSESALPSATRLERPPRERRERQPKQRAPSKWETHADLLEAFWQRCLSLGRAPDVDEFDRTSELRTLLGLPSTIFKKLTQERGAEAISARANERRDDILVFLALNLFERRRSFGALPEAVQRDLRAFFGSFQIAQTEAQRLLFSAGKAEVIRAACEAAAASGLGYLDAGHSLQLHSSMANELPAVLRVYLGCAARLYGDVETADVVKVHVESGKLTLMSYDDFEGKAIPELIERVKINLRRQQIDFFEYGSVESPTQPLYLKARLIRPGFPAYDEQLAFDQALEAVDGLDLSGFGPSKDALAASLLAAGVTLDGFTLK
jgi:DNA phosphorothioation-associated putative methyltransferase